jgi:hypothetical protein
MIRIERYTRWKRIPRLSSAMARKSPSAKERRTVPAAKAKFQTRTRMNGRRTVGSWITAAKFFVPTYVFQPGSSTSLPCANSPWPSSR